MGVLPDIDLLKVAKSAGEYRLPCGPSQALMLSGGRTIPVVMAGHATLIPKTPAGAFGIAWHSMALPAAHFETRTPFSIFSISSKPLLPDQPQPQMPSQLVCRVV